MSDVVKVRVVKDGEPPSGIGTGSMKIRQGEEFTCTEWVADYLQAQGYVEEVAP